ncbi:MAG: hypothetical protein KIT16_21470, partial [Rhodospirillaceae bacterium]|nr:hypothetical protein [Rhodospirillaceae bacterium]
MKYDSRHDRRTLLASDLAYELKENFDRDGEKKGLPQSARSFFNPPFLGTRSDRSIAGIAERNPDAIQFFEEFDAERMQHEKRWAPLAGYVPIKGVVEPRTGFKAIVLEKKLDDGTVHRIYAIAGAEASALSIADGLASLGGGRVHAESEGARELIEHAAKFARDNPNGRVTITGQSLAGGV